MAKIDTSGWKEFRVGDLFDSKTGSFDIRPQHLSDDGTLVVSAGTANNGIIGRTEVDVAPISGNTITVDMFGHTIFRDYPYTMVTHARVFALIPKNVVSKSVGQFVAGVLNRQFLNYAYDNMCSFRKVENEFIKLPATPSGEPDWVYMDEYMSAVMRESGASLESLRQTDGEKHALSVSGWREFIIGDLFEKLQLDVKKEDFNKTFDVSEERTEEFNLPLVNAKHGNNGIMYYGREADFETAEMTIDIVQNGAIATGDVYAQPQRTGVLWDAYLVKPKAKIDSAFTLMFLATVLEKAIKDKFSYDDKCVWDKAKLLTVTLPCTSDNEPDWAYMDEYMRTVMERTKSDLLAMQSIS
ncbi:restriction endonuclease subunit S [Alloscardovia criceti]|uniref:restriction endonuclease subunit S n=1 Tax=Alloscardovia criceti TaxID=356828 RepID=UPI0003775C52|nr:restriction endonuclease subunit S [Alloscardovia criceti]